MNSFLNAILRPYQKIIDKGDENGNIPHDILMPLISLSDFEKLCLCATNRFLNQDIIVSVPSNTYVVGDLHGNILDLLRILRYVGDLTKTRILFLGDYVDRGQFSIEVVALLFCLTCLYPDNIFLIRGNHEFRKVNETYGFKQQIVHVFESISPWEKANSAFDSLPLAAVIDNKIFCVHGGITPNIQKIAEIPIRFTRPIYNYDDDILYDIMWGDPTTSTHSYVPSIRGIGNQFGIYALNQFLADNNFIQMIRAHQCVHDGVQQLFDGKLITVFSSSNYGELPNGNAGFLLVKEDLSEKNFILVPYATIIDRKDTHFVPINTNKLSPLNPFGDDLQASVIPLSHSMSRFSLNSRMPLASKKTKQMKLLSGPCVVTKPVVKKNTGSMLARKLSPS